MLTREALVNEDLVERLRGIFLETRSEDYEFVSHRWDEGRVSEPIVSFSVRRVVDGKLVHPELVAKILLEGYGLQIRFGGLCSDVMVEEMVDDMFPVLLKGVWRISIPT